VDLAPAIKRYFTSDLYRGLGERRNDGPYQDGGREFPCSAHLAVAF